MSVLDRILDDLLTSSSEKDDDLELNALFSSKEPISPYPKKYSKELPWQISDETDLDNIFDDVVLDDKHSYDSTENTLNKVRSKLLNKAYTRQFIKIICEEDFEFGYISRSEEIVRDQLKVNELATRNWLNEIFIQHFADEKIAIGVLRIIGRFEPSEIFPQGQTIALAALIHKSDEIKELGVRAFEKWCSYESYEILKSVQVESKWLSDYIDAVIEDFEDQLCLY